MGWYVRAALVPPSGEPRFKQKTAYEIMVGDWSSDVCSSDLRVAYEPNTLDSAGPRESAERGYVTYAEQESGEKQRIRSETFADHYSQARLFFRSMSEPEQRHIISAFAFELGKVETVAVRKRMLGHLLIIDEALGDGVEAALGMEGDRKSVV